MPHTWIEADYRRPASERFLPELKILHHRGRRFTAQTPLLCPGKVLLIPVAGLEPANDVHLTEFAHHQTVVVQNQNRTVLVAGVVRNSPGHCPE